MGRRDQFKQNVSPVEKIIEWAGDRDDGFFYFYDKDQKKKVALNTLEFVALGERASLAGYSQSLKTGLFSNEVESTENQVLTVKYRKDDKIHEFAKGKYKEIKEQCKANGAKFCANVYAMILDCDEIETGTIVKIMMTGAAAMPWIGLKQSGNAEDRIIFNGASDEQNGGIKYRAPVFGFGDVDETEDEESEIAYEKVQNYFKNAPHTTDASRDDSPSANYTDADAPAEPELPEADDDDVPF